MADNTNNTDNVNNTSNTNNLTKETTIESPSVAFSIDMTLLKKTVTATYDVSSQPSTTPSDGSKIVTTRILVMPGSIKPGSQTDGITITDFVNDVNKIAGNLPVLKEDEIKEKIGNASNVADISVLDNISIVLKEIFFYYQSTKIYPKVSPSAHSDTPKDAGTSSFEYAFDIEIKNNGFMKNDIFTINSLSLAIWNTNRKKIIDTMNLTSIDDILND